jgi:hypothetical protein
MVFSCDSRGAQVAQLGATFDAIMRRIGWPVDVATQQRSEMSKRDSIGYLL